MRPEARLFPPEILRPRRYRVKVRPADVGLQVLADWSCVEGVQVLERHVDEAACIFSAKLTGGKPTIGWLISRTYDAYKDEYAAQIEVQADVVSEPR